MLRASRSASLSRWSRTSEKSWPNRWLISRPSRAGSGAPVARPSRCASASSPGRLGVVSLAGAECSGARWIRGSEVACGATGWLGSGLEMVVRRGRRRKRLSIHRVLQSHRVETIELVARCTTSTVGRTAIVTRDRRRGALPRARSALGSSGRACVRRQSSPTSTGSPAGLVGRRAWGLLEMACARPAWNEPMATLATRGDGTDHPKPVGMRRDALFDVARDVQVPRLGSLGRTSGVERSVVMTIRTNTLGEQWVQQLGRPNCGSCCIASIVNYARAVRRDRGWEAMDANCYVGLAVGGVRCLGSVSSRIFQWIDNEHPNLLEVAQVKVAGTRAHWGGLVNKATNGQTHRDPVHPRDPTYWATPHRFLLREFSAMVVAGHFLIQTGLNEFWDPNHFAEPMTLEDAQRRHPALSERADALQIDVRGAVLPPAP